jgi:hypothetical protein
VAAENLKPQSASFFDWHESHIFFFFVGLFPCSPLLLLANFSLPDSFVKFLVSLLSFSFPSLKHFISKVYRYHWIPLPNSRSIYAHLKYNKPATNKLDMCFTICYRFEYGHDFEQNTGSNSLTHVSLHKEKSGPPAMIIKAISSNDREVSWLHSNGWWCLCIPPLAILDLV